VHHSDRGSQYASNDYTAKNTIQVIDVLDGHRILSDGIDDLVRFRLEDTRIVGALQYQRRLADVVGMEQGRDLAQVFFVLGRIAQFGNPLCVNIGSYRSARSLRQASSGRGGDYENQVDILGRAAQGFRAGHGRAPRPSRGSWITRKKLSGEPFGWN